jgi:hypothetical protein
VAVAQRQNPDGETAYGILELVLQFSGCPICGRKAWTLFRVPQLVLGEASFNLHPTRGVCRRHLSQTRVYMYENDYRKWWVPRQESVCIWHLHISHRVIRKYSVHANALCESLWVDICSRSLHSRRVWNMTWNYFGQIRSAGLTSVSTSKDAGFSGEIGGAPELTSVREEILATKTVSSYG